MNVSDKTSFQSIIVGYKTDNSIIGQVKDNQEIFTIMYNINLLDIHVHLT